MDPASFLKGAAIGFSVAAPVGPIGVLCIRRSLRDGTTVGFVSGLGAATADAAYGCVAAFGLAAISGFLVRWQSVLGLGGGAFLCFLGIRALSTRPRGSETSSEPASTLAAFASTLFLTLANPATILSFLAIFAGVGLGTSGRYRNAATLVIGVFMGSAGWWLMLSAAVGLLRARVTPVWMQAINRISGVMLLLFGFYSIYRSLASS